MRGHTSAHVVRRVRRVAPGIVAPPAERALAPAPLVRVDPRSQGMLRRRVAAMDRPLPGLSSPAVRRRMGYPPPQAAHGARSASGWAVQFAPPSLDQGGGGPRSYTRAPGGDRPFGCAAGCSTYGEWGESEYGDEWGRQSRRQARRQRRRRRRRARRGRRRAFRDAPCDKPLKGSNLRARLNRRTTTRAIMQGTAGVASAKATMMLLAPDPTFLSKVAAGAIYATAAAIKIGGAIRKKRELALTGDQKAIAGWMRRMSRWSDRKRKRKLMRLSRRLERLVARCKRRKARWGGRGRARTKLLIKIAKTRLKVGALVAVMHHARRVGRHTPLVKGDPNTAADVTETDPEADLDSELDDQPPVPEAAGAEPSGPAGIMGIPTPVFFGGLAVLGLGTIAVVATRRR